MSGEEARCRRIRVRHNRQAGGPCLCLVSRKEEGGRRGRMVLSLHQDLTPHTSPHTPPHTAQSREQCVRGAGPLFPKFPFRKPISSSPRADLPTTSSIGDQAPAAIKPAITTCCPASATTQEEDTGLLLGYFYSSAASFSWWWVACPGRRASSWRPAPPPPPPVGPVCSWGRRIVRVRRQPSRPLCPGLFLGTCKHTQGRSWKTERGESRGEPHS